MTGISSRLKAAPTQAGNVPANVSTGVGADVVREYRACLRSYTNRRTCMNKLHE